MIGGSWKANFPAAYAFSQASTATVTMTELRRAFNHVYTLDLPCLEKPGIKDLMSVAVSPDTYPGVLTRAVFASKSKSKCVTKGDIARVAAIVACRLFRHIGRFGYIDRTVWMVGGREKLTSIGGAQNDYKDAKTRLVMMPEMTSELVQMCWSQLFAYACKGRRTPFMFGRKMTHGGWQELYDEFEGCNTIIEGDFSGWDTTVGRDHILVAMSII
jgi:hypothetical protein